MRLKNSEISERDFSKFLELVRVCIKNGLTDSQIYHLMEIINEDCYYSVFDEYMNIISSDGFLLKNGCPKKITVDTDTESFGPRPEPDEECKQRVTVCADGNVYITLKNFKGETKRKIRKKIDPDDAKDWMETVNTHIVFRPGMIEVLDAGSWDIEISYENGRCTDSGSLVCDGKWLHDYSVQLRSLLDMPELFLFSDIPGVGPWVCACEFHCGGKEYYYLSDRYYPAGEKIVVPVGEEMEMKEVTVVRVFSSDNLEPNIDITKLKSVYEPFEEMDKLSEMQKANDEILAEIMRENRERERNDG